MPTPDEYIDAGLYEPSNPAHRGRLDLLAWLDQEGFTIDDMVFADSTFSLVSMAGDRRLLLGSERLTRHAAIERSGLELSHFDRLAAAFGMQPLDPTPGVAAGEDWTVDEVRTLRLVGELASIFSEEEAIGFVRVMGGSLGRLADAAVSLFLNDVESPMLTDGRPEVELAQSVNAAVQLLDGLGAALDPILRRQVVQAIQRSRRAAIGITDRFNYRYAIGFVDLVGFTEVSRGMESQELAAFIRDFEGRTHDVVNAAGARVVKLIGDEVMFVATDADSVCRAAYALMEGFGDVGKRVLPRGGLAYGEVLVRGGDYYGSVVNLASRLVDEAVPQEVLATETLADATDASAFEPAGRRMVKGFDEPVAVRSLLGGR